MKEFWGNINRPPFKRVIVLKNQGRWWLPLYLKECALAPGGFEWGQESKGAAQLAYAMLRNLGFPKEQAMLAFSEFMRGYIAKLDTINFVLPEEKIWEWIKENLI